MNSPIRDVVFGLLVAAGGFAYSFYATRIPTSFLSDGVGAGGLPFILGLLVAGLGLVLSARSALALRRVRAKAGADDRFFSAAHLKGFLLLLFGAAYIILVPVVGYLPALALLIAATATAAGLRPSIKNLLIAVGMAVVMAFIFVTLMHTSQPQGLLPFSLPMLRF